MVWGALRKGRGVWSSRAYVTRWGVAVVIIHAVSHIINEITGHDKLVPEDIWYIKDAIEKIAAHLKDKKGGYPLLSPRRFCPPLLLLQLRQPSQRSSLQLHPGRGLGIICQFWYILDKT